MTLPIVTNAVLVDASTAAWLVHLLADGRRRARYDGLRLPEHVAATIKAIEMVAGAVVPEADGPSMSVRAAADMLDVSARRVTQLLVEGKLRGRKVRGSWEVDAGDVILRIGRDRKGSASEGGVDLDTAPHGYEDEDRRAG